MKQSEVLANLLKIAAENSITVNSGKLKIEFVDEDGVILMEFRKYHQDYDIADVMAEKIIRRLADRF